MKNDREIWENFKTGDRTAVSFVYFQNFGSLFQYGIKFIDDDDFVKDCIQDLFYKLIKSGEKLGPTDNIRFYLLKALKNTIYKEIGKSRKIQTEDIQLVKFDALFSIEEELEEKQDASMKEKALLKALKELTIHQREVIFLRFECGMDYDQICEMMQLKNDSARKLVFRAIKSLKAIIGDRSLLQVLIFIHKSPNML